MNLESVHVHVIWSARIAEPLRARLAHELRQAAWALSETEALLRDAHRATDLSHAYMQPRIELRLPLYEAGRRFKIVFSRPDEMRIELFDERGARLACIKLL